MNCTPKVRQKTFGVFFMSTKRKNRKHSLSEKLKVVEYYKTGYGCTTISKEMNISETIVQRWITTYRTLGVSGFKKQRASRLSASIKMEIVRDVLEKSLSFQVAGLKYNVSETAVYRWVSKVKTGGYSALAQTKQLGRPVKDMGRPKKKQPETEIEKLQEELRYLRAENAYLKKLRALVQERIARESGKQSGSSKH